MLGENGTGKTTFIRMLAGALDPDEGANELPRYHVRYEGGAVVFWHPFWSWWCRALDCLGGCSHVSLHNTLHPHYACHTSTTRVQC